MFVSEGRAFLQVHSGGVTSAPSTRGKDIGLPTANLPNTPGVLLSMCTYTPYTGVYGMVAKEGSTRDLCAPLISEPIASVPVTYPASFAECQRSVQ